MKPLVSETEDAETLRELGRASLQIVHDLKNQLNGLKLYATFLRKRMEKSERPADELETIDKLISGLERTATEMTTLVRYGRPVALRRAPRIDLKQILTSAVEGESFQIGDGAYEGEFDVAAITEALKHISAGARQATTNTAPPHRAGEAMLSSSSAWPISSAISQAPVSGALKILLRRDEDEAGAPIALIEWSGVNDRSQADLFRSFAGGHAVRMALAAKVIQAHGGQATHEANMLRVCLPLTQ